MYMNLADIMLLAAMLLLAGLALWFTFRRKKRGCGGGCSGCRYSGGCPSARLDEEDKERKE